jgi:hypothetical protein
VHGPLIIIVSLSVSEKDYAQTRKRGPLRVLWLIDHNNGNPQGMPVNYCSVCKREEKKMSENPTLHCPVCGSTRDRISGDALEKVCRENIPVKDSEKRVEKCALEKSFAINYNAPGGPEPATLASPGCDYAILPVHYRGGKFPVQVMARHRNAP